MKNALVLGLSFLLLSTTAWSQGTATSFGTPLGAPCAVDSGTLRMEWSKDKKKLSLKACRQNQGCHEISRPGGYTIDEIQKRIEILKPWTYGQFVRHAGVNVLRAGAYITGAVLIAGSIATGGLAIVAGGVIVAVSGGYAVTIATKKFNKLFDQPRSEREFALLYLEAAAKHEKNLFEDICFPPNALSRLEQDLASYDRTARMAESIDRFDGVKR
jgi:hypothetical protein